MHHHGEALRKFKKDPFLATVFNKSKHGELSALDQALLGYAEKLTLQPASVREEDVVALRQAGLSDRAIHDVCQITAYFNFVNRMADGLGVELEEG